MIASHITLDVPAIKRLQLYDPYAVHKFVYSLFPGVSREFLYGEKKSTKFGKTILILSERQPLIPEEGEIQIKRIPEDYLTHQHYTFQVQLNPVIRRNGMSTCIPVIGKEALRSWFLRKQSNYGFEVNPDSLEITDIGVIEVRKGKTLIVYNKATFSGVLHVTDRDRFSLAFRSGMGRGKAFGFGLLQIRPIS